MSSEIHVDEALRLMVEWKQAPTHQNAGIVYDSTLPDHLVITGKGPIEQQAVHYGLDLSVEARTEIVYDERFLASCNIRWD